MVSLAVLQPASVLLLPRTVAAEAAGVKVVAMGLCTRSVFRLLSALAPFVLRSLLAFAAPPVIVDLCVRAACYGLRIASVLVNGRSTGSPWQYWLVCPLFPWLWAMGLL